jgi:hypothetical protein
MLTTLFIIFVGLTPSLLWLWVMRQVDARAQERLRLAIEAAAARGLPGICLEPEHQYIEGLGYIIGDLTCRYNARSSHIRCAVNPSGPCDGCSHYQAKEL